MSKINMEDLELYELFVNSKADEKSSDVLPNAGEYHAAIAMSKLFDHTKNHVRMVVGNFEGNVSNQQIYLKSLEECVNKNIPIDIITLRSPNPNSTAYKFLLNKIGEGKDITIKQASDSFIDRLTIDGQEKHFSVFDDDKFRFEKDTKKYIAWFTFNGEKQCKNLINVFTSEFERL